VTLIGFLNQGGDSMVAHIQCHFNFDLLGSNELHFNWGMQLLPFDVGSPLLLFAKKLTN